MHKDHRANFATVIAADKQTRSVVGKQTRPSHLGLVKVDQDFSLDISPESTKYNNTLLILRKKKFSPLPLTNNKKKYINKEILYSFTHLIRIKTE